MVREFWASFWAHLKTSYLYVAAFAVLIFYGMKQPLNVGNVMQFLGMVLAGTALATGIEIALAARKGKSE